MWAFVVGLEAAVQATRQRQRAGMMPPVCLAQGPSGESNTIRRFGFILIALAVFAAPVIAQPAGSLQYAMRIKAEGKAFCDREFGPLQKRLVNMILRQGLPISQENEWSALRLSLMASEQALCDKLLKGDASGLETVLDSPDEHSAIILLAAAAVALDKDRIEDSGFLFYAGQLRLRFDERCFPPAKGGDENPTGAFQAYAFEVGGRINPAVMAEPQHAVNAQARLAKWHPKVIEGYSPGYEFRGRLTVEEANAAAEPDRAEFLKGMGECAALLGDPRYLAASRLVRGIHLASEEPLPSKEQFAEALETMRRIEQEKGLQGPARTSGPR
jgi:hypothetical protein